ncbi:MAG: acyl-phosphate glycerol 3-phosphate acyltransferase [Rhodobacterales bacterium]|nr:MAG: acyl-phosphate glycerol 3-phosphate acyltransferase [Rhodobacterales bacterium]
MPEIPVAPALLPLALTALAGYLLGSVPFGLVWTRAFGLGDLREIGSGNIGATNVLRTGNKFAAFLTLLGDAGKGAAAVLIAHAILGTDAGLIAGLAAYLGHLFPVYIGFRGGKGVATWLGTMAAISWPVGLGLAATWLVIAGLSRISSLAGIVAALSGPLWALAFGEPRVAAVAVVMGALIVLRHHANIRRLAQGTEPKIGRK